MLLLHLAMKSLWNRRLTAGLTMLTITVSVTLLLSVEQVRQQARESFASTVSGTDLIVGARTSQVQLLLYSVFRIGSPTANIRWQTYQDIAADKRVAWTIPLSLGDSHRGFRVLGTNQDYFRHYQHGQQQHLRFSGGRAFAADNEVVLGANVARKLGYQLGEKIVVSHGLGNVSFTDHEQHPFTVVGILEPTGTPVDRTVHVSLAGIEAMHAGFGPTRADRQPTQITAFLAGLKSKMGTFYLQRLINTYKAEPLMAVLPGVALQELWGMMGVMEQMLLLVAALVVLAGLIGMMTVIYTSLQERRREMSILRSVGARPWQICALFVAEALLLTGCGILAGTGLMYITLLFAQPVLVAQFGLHVAAAALADSQWLLLGAVFIAGGLAGLLPGLSAYRTSLADGMTVRT